MIRYIPHGMIYPARHDLPHGTAHAETEAEAGTMPCGIYRARGDPARRIVKEKMEIRDITIFETVRSQKRNRATSALHRACIEPAVRLEWAEAIGRC